MRCAVQTPLADRVACFIHRHQLLQEGETVLVGVSGGSDSLALLHLLHVSGLKLHLFAAYIDHGLRPQESPGEQRLIRQQCSSLGIPFVSSTVDVPHFIVREKSSPEEAARLLRYQALEELRRRHGATAIAVGHTGDDQVEEFFLRLLRGSGRKGFCGMDPRHGFVIRPLLEERKATLMRYLENHHLSWCFDSSNAHRQFLRNRVRLELLPFLERDFSPGLHTTVRRTMEIFGAEENLLTNLGQTAFESCLIKEKHDIDTSRVLTLDTAACNQQHPALMRRIIETCFWKMGAQPSFRQIELVGDLLKHGKKGGILHLKGGLRAQLLEGRLCFTRLESPLKGRATQTIPAIALSIPGPGCYPLPAIGRKLCILAMSKREEVPHGVLSLDANTVTFPLELRSVRPGERFHPCNGKGSKKVNRFLNDRKIPSLQRWAWPVLAQGGRILAIPGLEINHSCRITEETVTILTIAWQPLATE